MNIAECASAHARLTFTQRFVSLHAFTRNLRFQTLPATSVAFTKVLKLAHSTQTNAQISEVGIFDTSSLRTNQTNPQEPAPALPSAGQSETSMAPPSQPSHRRDGSTRHRSQQSHGRKTSHFGRQSQGPKLDLPWRDGMKRKADEPPPQSRAPQKLRPDRYDTLMDIPWITQNLELPKAGDYPDAPKALFVLHEAAFKSVMMQQMKSLKMSHNWAAASFPGVDAGFRAVVKCQIPNSATVEASGDGLNKKSALDAGYLAMLSKLHTDGYLRAIYADPAEHIDADTLSAESDAIMEVYDYAARFGLVPTISIRKLPSLRSRGRGKGGSLGAAEFTIELPEQNIRASTVARKLEVGLIGASIKFKEQAESFHAMNGDAPSGAEDSTTLTSATIKDFPEFLKSQGMNLELQHKQTSIPVHPGSAQHCQVLLDGQPVGPPTVSTKKQKAESMALLSAATLIAKEKPDLKSEYLARLSKSGGGLLVPVRPVTLELDPDAAYAMEQTYRLAREQGLPDESDMIESDEGRGRASRHFDRSLPANQVEAKSRILKEQRQAFETDPSLEQLRQKRAELPMTQFSQQVLTQIQNYTFSVVIGATGSGKTTQVPQILLDDAIAADEGALCNIVCTQPRRIAATSVARRVADERNEKLRQSVGYQVRFDATLPQPGGSITYCTTGILLQQLQNNPDEVLDSLSHIVVDEVHERDILIDFLLILIKKNVHARLAQGKRVPKIVLMSATIDADLFMRYFTYKRPDGSRVECPSISVPGRTFPVKEHFLDDILGQLRERYGRKFDMAMDVDRDSQDYLKAERAFRPTNSRAGSDTENGAETTIDWRRGKTVGADGQVVDEKEDALVPLNLVGATIAHIAETTQDGAILVFLPGIEEIRKVDKFLDERPFGVNFSDPAKFQLHRLHSSVPAAEQSAVFNPVPEGCRKIILSTNIAETSVTIPDIQYVVDTGKLREKRYDQLRRITKLQCTWVSKSNSKQRAGRAGRVQNGNYFALFTRGRFNSLRNIGLPEMLRSDLQEVCLDIKAQAFKTPIRQFLSEALEPPSPSAVDSSVSNLVSLEALTEEEKLTALGRFLAALPIHPSLGKMIVLAVVFRCLDPMLILGAAMNERSLFIRPYERDRIDQVKQLHAPYFEDVMSDHLATVNAFVRLRNLKLAQGPYAVRHFCGDNFLHSGAFQSIAGTCEQIEEVLVTANLVPRCSPLERRNGEYGHPDLNANSDNLNLVKGLLVAGLHPNLAALQNAHAFRTPGEKNVTISHTSANATLTRDNRRGAPSALWPSGTLCTYTSMAAAPQGNSFNLRDTTITSPLQAVLFGGKLKQRPDQSNVLEMDGWLPFFVRGSWRDVRSLYDFRRAKDAMLTKTFGELAQLNTQGGGGNGRGLIDDPLREEFAKGLVQVMDRDWGVRRKIAPDMFRERGGSWR